MRHYTFCKTNAFLILVLKFSIILATFGRITSRSNNKKKRERRSKINLPR